MAGRGTHLTEEVSTLDPERRKRLLDACCWALHPDRDDGEIFHAFLPIRAHGDLLRDNAVLVEGERGSGKTALFRFLSAVQSQGWALEDVIPHAPKDQRWVPGFAESGQAHPGVATLTRWAQGKSREVLERFWLGHLGGCLAMADLPGSAPGPALRYLSGWRSDRNQIEAWVDALGPEVGRLQTWLDRLDMHLHAERQTVVLGYDDLDRLVSDQGIASAAPLVEALVSVWVGLVRRYRRIRARIFLRPDLYNLARASTTDASKLDGYTAHLTWTQEDVFRVLLRRLGTSDLIRTWLQEKGRDQIPFRMDPRLGWLPPYALPGGQQMFSFMPQPKEVVASLATQQSLGRKLAGDFMGSGSKKGYTHLWIMNHSRDGLGRFLPRVTLNLVRFAAEGALARGPMGREDRLLHPSELEAAQEPTGAQRLNELKEVAREVVNRLELLRDATVPLLEQDAIARLGNPADPGGDGREGGQILRRLLDLGVLTRRLPPRKGDPQRIDVPDLFRKALGIRRRGGPLQIHNLPALSGAGG